MSASVCRIDFKSMHKDNLLMDFHLDDAFFAHPDMSDITTGNVEVKVEIRRTASLFDITFGLQGQVSVLCDRCLDALTLSINTDAHLIVKYGSEYFEESEEVLVIPETAGSVDLSWMLYEYVLLSLPMQHFHPDGECNTNTIAAYQNHLAIEADEAEKEALDDCPDTALDPRWRALEALRNGSNND